MAAKPLAILKQYWFFVGVIVVLAAGYFAYAPLARVSKWQLGAYELRTWLITVTMVFTAFTLPIRNIGAGLRNWIGLLLLIMTSYLVYPAAAWGVAHAGWTLQGLDPHTSPLADWTYGAGLILMAAVPTTLASGIIWTRQGGGDDALALVGMVLSLVISIFLTPLLLSWTLFPLLEGGAAGFDPRAVQVKLVYDLTYLILIPVAVGQGLRLMRGLGAWGDRHRGRISVVLQLIVLTTIGLSVAGQMAQSATRGAKPSAAQTAPQNQSAADLRDTPPASVATAPAGAAAATKDTPAPSGGAKSAVQPNPTAGLPAPGVLAIILVSTLLVHTGTLVMGWCLARWTGRSRAVTIAVALNGAQKTLPVAILVESLLPGAGGPLDGAVWTFILVHVTQLLLDAALLPRMKQWADAEKPPESVAGTPAPTALPVALPTPPAENP